MRTKLLVVVSLLILLSTSVYAGGLFGRRNQASSVFCQPSQQQVYQQSYQYYQPYQAVAAIPLSTVPVAVDLQAYMYSVNSSAFQSFRDYMNSKSPVSQEQPASPPPAQAQVDDGRSPGIQTLVKNCKGCHSGATPKAGFSIFDAKGNVYTKLPWGKILDRVSSNDPEVRMPPKGSLAVSDILAVVRLASPPVNAVYNPLEVSGSPEQQPQRVASLNPFE